MLSEAARGIVVLAVGKKLVYMFNGVSTYQGVVFVGAQHFLSLPSARVSAPSNDL